MPEILSTLTIAIKWLFRWILLSPSLPSLILSPAHHRPRTTITKPEGCGVGSKNITPRVLWDCTSSVPVPNDLVGAVTGEDLLGMDIETSKLDRDAK